MIGKSKQKTISQKANKSKFRLWIAISFVLGFVLGYGILYTIVNWNGFFVKCPNGVRPDKYGCCAGEVYTDAGDGWMVCCPDGSTNCFPPLK